MIAVVVADFMGVLNIVRWYHVIRTRQRRRKLVNRGIPEALRTARVVGRYLPFGPYLALGIGLHGLWDIAHYSRTSFVDDWYTLACLLVDVALAIYIAGQVPQWLETRPLQYPRL